jgi:triacylglycerol esterase/lipase EstA (alpha/beta hydrolase family)
MKKFLLTLSILTLFFISLYAEDGSVFCIHGFFRTSRCMLPMGRALKREGLRPYLWAYPSRSRTIEEHAAHLVEDLKSVAAQYPNRPIHFVTHSLGGLILRATLNHPDCPQEAKCGKALLLAPPNKGSRLARQLHGCPLFRFVFGDKSGKQLLTYGEEEINQLGHFPEGMKVCIIAGNKGNKIAHNWLKESNDGKVAVSETHLSTPHHHLTYYVTHTWIMTHKKTLQFARAFFK